MGTRETPMDVDAVETVPMPGATSQNGAPLPVLAKCGNSTVFRTSALYEPVRGDPTDYLTWNQGRELPEIELSRDGYEPAADDPDTVVDEATGRRYRVAPDRFVALLESDNRDGSSGAGGRRRRQWPSQRRRRRQRPWAGAGNGGGIDATTDDGDIEWEGSDDDSDDSAAEDGGAAQRYAYLSAAPWPPKPPAEDGRQPFAGGDAYRAWRSDADGAFFEPNHVADVLQLPVPGGSAAGGDGGGPDLGQLGLPAEAFLVVAQSNWESKIVWGSDADGGRGRRNRGCGCGGGGGSGAAGAANRHASAGDGGSSDASFDIEEVEDSDGNVSEVRRPRPPPSTAIVLRNGGGIGSGDSGGISSDRDDDAADGAPPARRYRNRALEAGAWVRDVVWDGSAPPPRAPRLVLNYNDPSLVISGGPTGRPVLRARRAVGEEDEAATREKEMREKMAEDKRQRLTEVARGTGVKLTESMVGKGPGERVLRPVDVPPARHAPPAMKLETAKPFKAEEIRNFRRPRMTESALKVANIWRIRVRPHEAAAAAAAEDSAAAAAAASGGGIGRTISSSGGLGAGTGASAAKGGGFGAGGGGGLRSGMLGTPIHKEKDLYVTRGDFIVVEYSEERPPLVSLPGMASRFINWYRPPDNGDSGTGTGGGPGGSAGGFGGGINGFGGAGHGGGLRRGGDAALSGMLAGPVLKRQTSSGTVGGGSGAGGSGGDLRRPPERVDGQTWVLDKDQESPFVGDVAPGMLQPSLCNRLFRAPLFEHAARDTDFLLVREARPRGRWNYRGVEGKGGGGRGGVAGGGGGVGGGTGAGRGGNASGAAGGAASGGGGGGGGRKDVDLLVIRAIPRVYVAGQTEPQHEVYEPNKHDLLAFQEQYFILLLARMLESKPTMHRMKETLGVMGATRDRIRHVLQVLGAVGERSKDNSSLPRTYRRGAVDLQDKMEELASRISPEEVCAYESMLAARRHLEDCGISLTSSEAVAKALLRLKTRADNLRALVVDAQECEKEAATLARAAEAALRATPRSDGGGGGKQLNGGAGAVAASAGANAARDKAQAAVNAANVRRAAIVALLSALRQQSRDLEALQGWARYIHEELQLAPWTTAGGYVRARVRREPSAALSVSGVGDPSGVGEALSFVPQLPVHLQPKPKKNPLLDRATERVTGTAGDMRKLTMPQLEAQLRALGLDSAAIAKLHRWDRVKMIQNLCYVAVSEGASSADKLALYTRKQRQSPADAARRNRADCQRVWKLQAEILSRGLGYADPATLNRMLLGLAPTRALEAYTASAGPAPGALAAAKAAAAMAAGGGAGKGKVLLGSGHVGSAGGGCSSSNGFSGGISGTDGASSVVGTANSSGAAGGGAGDNDFDLDDLEEELNTSAANSHVKGRSVSDLLRAPDLSAEGLEDREDELALQRLRNEMIQSGGGAAGHGGMAQRMAGESEREAEQRQAEEEVLSMVDRSRLPTTAVRRITRTLGEDGVEVIWVQFLLLEEAEVAIRNMSRSEQLASPMSHALPAAARKGEAGDGTDGEGGGAMAASAAAIYGPVATGGPMPKLNLTSMQRISHDYNASKKRAREESAREEAAAYKRPMGQQPSRRADRRNPTLELNRALQDIVEDLSARPEAYHFRTFVGKEVPNYLIVVGGREKQRNFKSMGDKARSSKYTSREGFLADMRQMVQNSVAYNTETHLVTTHARALLRAAEDRVAARVGELAQLEVDIVKQHQAGPSGGGGGGGGGSSAGGRSGRGRGGSGAGGAVAYGPEDDYEEEGMRKPKKKPVGPRQKKAPGSGSGGPGSGGGPRKLGGGARAGRGGGEKHGSALAARAAAMGVAGATAVPSVGNFCAPGARDAAGFAPGGLRPAGGGGGAVTSAPAQGAVSMSGGPAPFATGSGPFSQPQQPFAFQPQPSAPGGAGRVPPRPWPPQPPQGTMFGTSPLPGGAAGQMPARTPPVPLAAALAVSLPPPTAAAVALGAAVGVQPSIFAGGAGAFRTVGASSAIGGVGGGGGILPGSGMGAALPLPPAALRRARQVAEAGDTSSDSSGEEEELAGGGA